MDGGGCLFFGIMIKKFKVALNLTYRTFFQTLLKVTSYTAYQNSVIRQNFTLPVLKYKRLKLKLRVFFKQVIVLLW